MDTISRTPYIEPNFSLATSFKKILDNHQGYSYLYKYLNDTPKTTLSDILERTTLVILAEPGQGKTRLLSELANLYDGMSVIIDLKSRVGNESIEDLVARTTPPSVQSDKPPLILLDALDEVPARDVIATINHIKTYIQLNPSHKVFLSCRVHFFAKYEHFASGLSRTEFLLIEPLETRQAKDFLHKIGIDQSDVTKLFESVKFTGRENPTVLHTPRYLEMLSDYIKENPEKVKNINRADLFEAFVSKALLIEDSKNGRQLALYKKRFLEKLALVMEISQQNSIKEDDLLTFIDEVKSDVKMALVNQIDIEELYEHSLLKKTDLEVSFANAEIQEYLAAKGILRLKDPLRTVFDVAIEPNLREPLPSWLNTLTFIIDEIPGLAVRILSIKPEMPTSEDEVWHKLVTGSNSPSLNDEDKETIFTRVWGYYLSRRQYIGTDVSMGLANYISQEQIYLFIEDFQRRRLTQNNEVLIINTIRVVGDIIALHKIPAALLEGVVNKLTRIALNCKNRTVQYNAIGALRKSNDTTLIDKLYRLVKVDDDLILGGLQALAYEIDKNHPKSIHIFANGIKKGRSSYSQVGIEDIDDPAAITIFLKILSVDTDLIKEIIDNNRIFVKEDRRFLRHLERYWQDAWLAPLKLFVINAATVESGYYAERSDFVTEIIKLIVSKDQKYFSQLLARVSQDGDKGLYFLFTMSKNMAEIMTIDDTASVKAVMSKHEHLQRFILRDILTALPRTNNPDSQAIEQWSRAEYPDLYVEYDEQMAKFQKLNEQDKLTEEFTQTVEEIHSEDKIVSGNAVLQAMNSLESNITDQSAHKQKIQYTEEQVAAIWSKAKELFLDPFDPIDTNLKIKNKEGGDTKSYTITRSTNWFQAAITFGYATNREDLAEYRNKLINLIPYAYYDDMRAILATLTDLTDQEKELAIKAYKDCSTDTALFLPDNLVEVAEKYLIRSAAPILREFIDLDLIHEHIRIKALEVLNLLEPDKEVLRAVFEKYAKDTGTETEKKIALRANELLITIYSDDDSIKWRLKYVRDNSFEFVYPAAGKSSRAHLVGPLEEELQDGKVLKPLKDMGDPKYIQDFLDLLTFSFEVYEKGATWHNYATYLWGAIDTYFTGLSSLGNYEPINKLEERIKSHHDQNSVAPYIRHLSAIKRSYLEALGKPRSFTACVQRLNKLSSQNYLPISSTRELYEIVKSVVEDDLTKWLSVEGSKLLTYSETPAQRFMFNKLETLFLRKGFIGEEVVILRESQTEIDTRTDFQIYYGFYGPILIELKRSDHSDLQGKILDSKESYKSLEKYMHQFRAEYGIFLVYETQQRSVQKWNEHLKKIRSTYASIKGIDVIGLS